MKHGKKLALQQTIGLTLGVTSWQVGASFLDKWSQSKKISLAQSWVLNNMK